MNVNVLATIAPALVRVLVHGARTQMFEGEPLYLGRVPWAIWKTTGTRDMPQRMPLRQTGA